MIKKPDTKVDFVSIEHKVLDFWTKERIFEKRRQLNQGKHKWSFIDGPITANNPMGVHHAWGRTLKDIFNRYCLLYTSPSPRDKRQSRMPSSA